MKKKYFAIGFKGWVELRTATAAPKPIVSKVTRTHTESTLKFVYNDEAGRALVEPKAKQVSVQKKIPLTAVIHDGGDVVCSVRDQEFQHITGMVISNGHVQEITDLAFNAVVSYRKLKEGAAVDVE